VSTATHPPDRVAGLVVPPLTVAARVERVFLEREVAGGQRLSALALARELGAHRAAPTQTLRRLRALRKRDPELGTLRTRFAAIQRMTAAKLATVAEQARVKHAEVIEVGWWWQAAACRGMDTQWFFPADSDRYAAARAKRVCAACPVRSECLRAELAAPVGRAAEGIVGGLAPWERTRLRVACGLARNATAGRFLADRELTVAAHQRAVACVQLCGGPLDADLHGTLVRAFDRWGACPPARPSRLASRQQTAEVYRLACTIGITAAARQLHADKATLRAAFHRFGLAWPRPRVPLVDPVFFQLNPQVLIPRRLSPQAASARVRRQEAFETLGARVVYALAEENGTRPQVRAWRVARRARQARHAALAAHLAARPPLAAVPAVEADRTPNRRGSSGRRPGRTAA
jgi:WhiB family redox-sensing transcriptional regulator